MRVAVIDATLLSRLADLELAPHLPWLFDRILVPKTVRSEVRVKRTHRLALRGLLVRQGDFFRPCPDADPVVSAFLHDDLDPGEADVIAQAKEVGATALIDEEKAVKRAALEGVVVRRTGAVLLGLKELGRIEIVRPFLDALAKAGFWLSPAVRAEILSLAGEPDGE